MPQNCFWQFTVICIERTKIKKKCPGITDYWKKCQCSNHFLTGSHENKLWGSLTSWPNAINTFFCFHLFDGNKCAPFCFDSSGNSTQSGPCKRLLNYSHFYNLSISLRTLYFSNNLEVRSTYGHRIFQFMQKRRSTTDSAADCLATAWISLRLTLVKLRKFVPDENGRVSVRQRCHHIPASTAATTTTATPTPTRNPLLRRGRPEQCPSAPTAALRIQRRQWF